MPAGVYADLFSVHHMPQGVDIAAHPDHRTGLRAFQYADDAVAARVHHPHFVPGLPQFSGQVRGGLFLMSGRLGRSVQIIPYLVHSLFHQNTLLY
jgi:hypothetical protein